MPWEEKMITQALIKFETKVNDLNDLVLYIQRTLKLDIKSIKIKQEKHIQELSFE